MKYVCLLILLSTICFAQLRVTLIPSDIATQEYGVIELNVELKNEGANDITVLEVPSGGNIEEKAHMLVTYPELKPVKWDCPIHPYLMYRPVTLKVGEVYKNSIKLEYYGESIGLVMAYALLPGEYEVQVRYPYTLGNGDSVFSAVGMCRFKVNAASDEDKAFFERTKMIEKKKWDPALRKNIKITSVSDLDILTELQEEEAKLLQDACDRNVSSAVLYRMLSAASDQSIEKSNSLARLLCKITEERKDFRFANYIVLAKLLRSTAPNSLETLKEIEKDYDQYSIDESQRSYCKGLIKQSIGTWKNRREEWEKSMNQVINERNATIDKNK